MKIWSCKIGECDAELLPDGADAPIRAAVARAYRDLTGFDAAFCFSGWGAALDEHERAVVENREPSGEAYAQWLRRESADKMHALLCRSLDELTQLDGSAVVQLRADIRSLLADVSPQEGGQQ